MAARWENWSGSVVSEPVRLEAPADEQGIVAAVRQAAAGGLNLRVAGTGHSFLPLVAADGVILDLAGYAGLDGHDPALHTAVVRSGTKLHALGELLHPLGLAMENMGDVDVQAVAGAVGTGTHGTGPTFGNIPTQVAALRLVTAGGEIVTCSEREEPDLFHAARVSLGMLGVISTLTMQLVPAFRLHERVWREPVADTLAKLDQRIAENEHYEFFWYPSLDVTECKTLNTTTLTPEELPPQQRRATGMAGLAENIGDQAGERIGWSHQIIPSERTRKFNEMEYSVPAELGPACFAAVRERMRSHHPDVVWPVEYRTLRADDSWLSNAYGRATVTLSIHQDARLPFEPFFRDIETIFAAHAGRPHWGKIHYRTRSDLTALYPQFEQFIALRRRLDPEGRFLNDFLRPLFA